MRKYGFLILTLALIIYMTGCAKKQAVTENAPESLSMEELGSVTAETPAPAVSKEPVTQAPPVTGTKLEPLPPSGPYKPTNQEIQTALKNAGYYTGAIDGKIGPKTKKAIGDFQKASGLQADGKVGPKTWVLLSKHLNPTPSTTTTNE
jgi:murein L,D-transpeptidase YcbB/YkuD